MVVRKDDDTVKIHLSEISSIILQTNQVYISAYLLAELAKAKISFVVSDEKQNPVGQFLPLYGAHNVAKRVIEQLAWGEPIKKRVWQRIVRDKIKQQAALLDQRNCQADADRLQSLIKEVRSGDKTNREAQAARLYFRSLFGDSYSRDADTDFNAALNYGYAILLSMTNREIVSRGYITHYGICHKSEYNQFNLSCDFMEPFRPAVDRLVLDYWDGFFDSDIRRILADLPNKSIRYRGGTYHLDSVLSLYIQDCLNALNKLLSVEDIEPFEIL